MPRKDIIRDVNRALVRFLMINPDGLDKKFRLPTWLLDDPEEIRKLSLIVDDEVGDYMSTANDLGGAKTNKEIAKHVESRELCKKKKDIRYYLARLKWRYGKWKNQAVLFLKNRLGGSL